MPAIRQLLVDGMNVLHAWKWLGRGSDLGPAQERLVMELRTLIDVDGIAVTVVYDGSQPHRSERVDGDPDELVIVYAPSTLTADGVIERLVASAPDPAAISVVTADRMERQTVEAAGASTLSPASLREWLERSRSRVRRAGNRIASPGDFGNKLPL